MEEGTQSFCQWWMIPAVVLYPCSQLPQSSHTAFKLHQFSFPRIIWYKPAVCFWNGFQSTSRGSLVVEFGQMLLWELGKYPGMQTEMMSKNAGTQDTSHPAYRHLRSCGKCSCLNCQCQSLWLGHKYSAGKPPRPSPCECWDLYFLEIFTISWQLPLFLIRSIWTVVRKNPFEGGSVELLPNAYGIK